MAQINQTDTNKHPNPDLFQYHSTLNGNRVYDNQTT